MDYNFSIQRINYVLRIFNQVTIIGNEIIKDIARYAQDNIVKYGTFNYISGYENIIGPDGMGNITIKTEYGIESIGDNPASIQDIFISIPLQWLELPYPDDMQIYDEIYKQRLDSIIDSLKEEKNDINNRLRDIDHGISLCGYYKSRGIVIEKR